ncbi:MAG: Rv3235 family protein [Demequinaceae bacterium]|nr:Rv3235 family protein [Demequinaceae bacterium]
MSIVAATRPLRDPSIRSLSPYSAPASPYSRPRRVLGDPTPLACTVAKTALEIVLGGVGLDQLNRWVTPEIRASLARQGALALRSGRGRQAVVEIRRIRVYRASDVAAETSIVADDGTRVRAIAARFEDVGGRWQATVLDIG